MEQRAITTQERKVTYSHSQTLTHAFQFILYHVIFTYADFGWGLQDLVCPDSERSFRFYNGLDYSIYTSFTVSFYQTHTESHTPVILLLYFTFFLPIFLSGFSWINFPACFPESSGTCSLGQIAISLSQFLDQKAGT